MATSWIMSADKGQVDNVFRSYFFVQLFTKLIKNECSTLGKIFTKLRSFRDKCLDLCIYSHNILHLQKDINYKSDDHIRP